MTTTASALTVEQAKELADRTLAAIAMYAPPFVLRTAVDRERIKSDLAGLAEHSPEIVDGATCQADDCESCTAGDGHTITACSSCHGWDGDRYEHPCTDARRYADGLRQTAAIHGVQL